MKPVLGAAGVRALDRRAEALGVPPLLLMESAGHSAAEAVRRWDGERSRGRVLALCGPGGNGGDALSAARWLGLWGADVLAVVLGSPRGPAAEELRAFTASFPDRVVRVEDEASLGAVDPWFEDADLILDGILGVGASGEPRGLARAAIERLGACWAPVVAMDLPSGLDAEGGAVPGVAVQAELTLAMACLKPCHLLPPAAELCGRVEVVEVAYPPGAWEAAEPVAYVLEPQDVGGLLPKRPRFGHKGTFGRVLVVGGAVGMAGAAALAALGALRSGAGLVHVLVPEPVYPIVAGLVPEALVHPGPAEGGEFSQASAEEALRLAQGMDAVVVGPGLGRGRGPAEVVRALLRSGARLVLDADALYALAQDPELLRGQGRELVFTPHPGEFARLAGARAEDVGPDKIRLAREAAGEWGATLVLKGPPTAVADPSGRVVLATTGNTALAHGGSGDVLAGMIAALWAGGAGAAEAGAAAAFVHGRAAELLTAHASPRGALPTDLLAALAEAYAELEA